MYRGYKVALIVPCYNEATAIGQVIEDFKTALPVLKVYVFDNNSTDGTAEIALGYGAKVVHVSLPGKGNVVRRMFSDVDADIYIMTDGDATYHPPSVTKMIDKLIDEHLDMVVGCRKSEADVAGKAYRSGHQLGNKMLTQSVVSIFGGHFTDMLSGYRVFSKRYVKSFPALAKGFETETELTVHALELRMPFGEVVTPYGARPEGSESKLSTYSDGWRILKTIMKLYVRERPMQFFGCFSAVLFVTAVILFMPLLSQFITEGIVTRLPTAVLCASLSVSSLLSLCCGLIVDNVTRARHEMKRLAYLNIPYLKKND